MNIWKSEHTHEPIWSHLVKFVMVDCPGIMQIARTPSDLVTAHDVYTLVKNYPTSPFSAHFNPQTRLFSPGELNRYPA